MEESSTWLRRLFQQHLEYYKINCIRTQEQYHARLDSNYVEKKVLITEYKQDMQCLVGHTSSILLKLDGALPQAAQQ